MNNSKSKRLIGILTALVFVVIAAAILSVILANNKQKGDTAEKINVTTYDYLPLSIDSDGVVTTYVGANDGTAVVDIPASYSLSGQGLPIAGNDYAITKIADNAFKDVNFAFAKIDMANVTSVGTSAFENAKNVYLYGSENGYLIGDYAFRNATVAFDKIVLCADQGGTPSVGVSAFENSSSFDPTVTATTVASAKSDPNYVFAEDYTTSGTITASGASGIISITGTAFQNNGVATSVDFSSFKGILRIGQSAFDRASSLASVKLGQGITTLGNDCFDTSALTSFSCNGFLSEIPSGTFSQCSDLSIVTIPDTVTSIGDYAFGRCSSLTSINIPASVTSIGEGAFNESDSLSSVNIPSGVTEIGERAFEYCSALSSITIPSSVTSIGVQAFGKCTLLTKTAPGSTLTANTISLATNTNLTNLSWLPDTIKIIGAKSFNYWTNLSAATIPSSVTSISEGAFSGCSDLTSMTLPFAGSGTYDCRSGETLFGYIFEYTQDQGFYDITQTYETMDSYGGTYETTKTFSLPEGLNSITITKFVPDYAFSGCKYTNNVTLANSVTSIGSYAFSGCSALSSITIPSSVTSIGRGAFSGCSGLKSIALPFGGTNASGTTGNSIGALFNTSSATNIGTKVTPYESGTKTGKTYYIPDSLDQITITGSSNHTKLYSTEVSGLGDAISTLTIGDAITNMESQVFYGTDMTTLSIPSLQEKNISYFFSGQKTKTSSSDIDTSVYPSQCIYSYDSYQYNDGNEHFSRDYYYGAVTTGLLAGAGKITVTKDTILPYCAFQNLPAMYGGASITFDFNNVTRLRSYALDISSIFRPVIYFRSTSVVSSADSTTTRPFNFYTDTVEFHVQSQLISSYKSNKLYRSFSHDPLFMAL